MARIQFPCKHALFLCHYLVFSSDSSILLASATILLASANKLSLPQEHAAKAMFFFNIVSNLLASNRQMTFFHSLSAGWQVSTDKLLILNNLSRKVWGFPDKITFCEITINSNSRGAHKKMRCVTKNGTTQNWIESNNLHVVIWCILLSIKKI